MKWIKRLFFIFLLILFIAFLSFTIWSNSSKPNYSDSLKITGLQNEVNVLFDDFGIPHIYAQTETDAYKALGYVHAQERLFQMELIRRVGRGTLAEILGANLVEVDKLFRSLNVKEHAEQSAKIYLSEQKDNWQKAALAYQDGINQFIKNGPTPPEFTLLGIEKEAFQPADMYLTIAYMAFGFADGLRTDLLLDKMYRTYGANRMNDFHFDWQQDWQKMPANKDFANQPISNAAQKLNSIIEKIPIPLLEGSNSWVISPEKSATGKVLLCNDTHIRYGSPSVWYEAHLHFNGKDHYGNFLAGYPFPPVAHNEYIANGLTMLKNDNTDFYQLEISKNDPNKYVHKGKELSFKSRQEIIKIDGKPNDTLVLRTSHYGPIINEAYPDLTDEKAPIALFWTYLKFPNRLLQANYTLANAKNLNEFKLGVSMIDAPGLNVMYGDKEGNIAWWACAKLIKRPDHVQSKLILDGSSGKDDPLGWYTFDKNPQAINPPNGYVYSANNQPHDIDGVTYKGYYVPEHRAKHIVKLLNKKEKFSRKEMLAMMFENDAPFEIENKETLLDVLSGFANKLKGGKYLNAYQHLKNWDGNHDINNKQAALYHTIIDNICYNTFFDELGEKDYKAFVMTQLFKKSYGDLFKNENSLWYDDIKTDGFTETRQMVFENSFKKAVDDLSKQFGSNMDKWNWGNIHTIEQKHPLGIVKPLNYILNVGPKPMPGTSASINNQGFFYDGDGKMETFYGPAMRLLVDFENMDNSVSVLPTGQSGHFKSKHYNDQFEMFNQGKYRPMLMNKEIIEKTCKRKLVLKPN